MCRIAGIAGLPFNAADAYQWVSAMCNVQAHGGPDDAGINQFTEAGITLGHRRLSLLDVSNCGHQPMAYLNHLHISYNGEIYNFKSIKSELTQIGHQFKSQTDTEVIMAAYNQWGTAAFNRFEGMFAFALWDAQTQQLILARDATGIKPLYYKHSSTGLSFASEIRAMATLPHMQEDATWPVQLMAFGHLPEPVTTLQNVKPIPKGCFLQYSPSTNTVSWVSK